MKALGFAGVITWIAGCALCLAAVWSYKATPGRMERACSAWPADSEMAPSRDLPTLVLFLHPRCPCSRASVEELAAILTAAPGAAAVHVALYRPGNQPLAWATTDVWSSVSKFPGVSVRFDVDAVEARRFGAATSGHALLFDRHGRLEFSGGITGVRGHEGINPGRQAVIDLLHSKGPALAAAPVFGCPIFSDSNEAAP
jgi:hypothetical protein